MGRVVAIEFLSVDGVMQGLGSPDEDTEGGFIHGGWGARHAESIHQVVSFTSREMPAAYLFGRKTYDKMAAFWPHQPDTNPIAANMNAVPKYVVSGTLVKATWGGTRILSGAVVDEVRRVKGTVEGDVAVLGSGQLCRTLMAGGVVDELRLFIHPLLLGQGKRLFGTLPAPCELELRDVARTDLGTVALTYRVIGMERELR